MKRHVVLASSFLVACALGGRATEPAPLTVLSAPRAVRFDEPVGFFREGARVPSSGGVLFAIWAPDLISHLATAITPPQVVYGSGVCIQVGELAGPARIDILCPQLASSDEPLLWLTLPGAFETELTAKRMLSERAHAKKMGRTASVAPPAGPPEHFKALPELRASLMRAPPEAPDAGPR